MKTIYQYNKSIGQLASEIERVVPDPLHDVSVGREIFHGAIECPRAIIEVGARGMTPRANITWATKEIARYGADRVSWRYFVEGTIK